MKKCEDPWQTINETVANRKKSKSHKYYALDEYHHIEEYGVKINAKPDYC